MLSFDVFLVAILSSSLLTIAEFIVAISRWVSVGSDLKYDARRDLDDVGAKCVQGMKPSNTELSGLFTSSQCHLRCKQYVTTAARMRPPSTVCEFPHMKRGCNNTIHIEKC